MELHDSGSMSRRNIRALLHPSVRAASSMLGSRFSNAPSALRYMRGNATTTAAITVAGQLKMSGNPMSMKNWPNAVLRPHSHRSTKPHTVGGSTMGMVNTLSRTFLVRCDTCRQKYAAKSPSTKMMTMATPVVLSVTHKGLQSSVRRNSAAASKPVGAATISTSPGATSRPKSAKEGFA